jgi:hypothetical protein
MFVREVGLDARLLCKASVAAYGPLKSLAPRGIEDEEELRTALARHPQLEALNLKHIPQVVYGDTLAGLTCLLNLQALQMPLADEIASHELRTSLSLLTTLKSLSITADNALPSDMLDAILPLTNLQSLTVPPVTWDGAMQLSACSQLTRLRIDLAQPAGERQVVTDAAAIVACAKGLPALVSLVVDVQKLSTAGGKHYQPRPPLELDELVALTGLTQLHLATISDNCRVAAGPSCSQVAAAVGTMTRLRSLHLRLLGVEPLANRWLGRLTALTKLDVALYLRETSTEALEDVLAATPRLPALRSLQLRQSWSADTEHVAEDRVRVR